MLDDTPLPEYTPSDPPAYSGLYPLRATPEYQYSSSSPVLTRKSWLNPPAGVISYSGDQLSKHDVFTIFSHLAQNSTAEQLYLSLNTNLTDDTIPTLVAALRRNTTLWGLRLDSCSIGPGGAGMLGVALRGNATLRYLILKDNAILPEGVEKLMNGIRGSDGRGQSMSLEVLDLSANVIGDEGASIIATSLLEGRLPSLKELHLNFSNISDEGAAILATAISSHPLIQKLYLAENRIRKMGMKALDAAVGMNTRIVKISLHFNQELVKNRTRKDIKHAGVLLWKSKHTRISPLAGV